ncbi:MAG: CocE/NonD family hydrolase [Bacteroidota bacterium]
MKRSPLFSLLIISAIFIIQLPTLYGQKIAEPFEFQFAGKTLRGLIEKPQDQPSSAVVVLVPGSGRTNFVEGRWFSSVRDQLVSFGLTVVFWDKMGCGQSDGEFNILQPVQNSAKEALAGIQAIKDQQIPGSEKIGCWGVSRAGWIVPLINEQQPLDFWISISGTDDKENFGYLLKSNLRIAGKSEREAEYLFQAWMNAHRVQCTGGSYEEALRAAQPLMEDSLSRELFGYSSEAEITEAAKKAYAKETADYTRYGYFDQVSRLWVNIKEFDQTLLKVSCPVLALFGANDSQVDWRKTKRLYESTIGENPATSLTTKVFEQCNHNLQKCISCAWGEDLSVLGWQACGGYYETMETWLRKQGIIN